MEQGCLVPQYPFIAKQLFRVSKSLNEIFQDQLNIVTDLNAQNMFRVDQERHCVYIANGLFQLQFSAPTSVQSSILCCDFNYVGQKAELVEEFILHDLYFLTGDLKPQHSLFLRQKAQQFRQVLLDQVYVWINGAERVSIFLKQLSLLQAEMIDHLMMKADFYQSTVLTDCVINKTPVPEYIIKIVQEICSIQGVCADEVLPIQPLMECLDDFCFSAAQFLPRPMYRILALSFAERFNLNELIEHQDDINLLYRHAEEKSHLLGFVRLMRRELWQRDDLLSKHNFLDLSTTVWQKKVAKLPLFDYPRAVNWLFKQSTEVLDWLSENIQQSSVRVAVTALSFVDSSQMHPQIILATLQYFQHSSARMFIQSCHYFAMQEAWFEHEKNYTVILKGQKQSIDDHRIAINPSILYLDEWMALMRNVAKTDAQMTKHIYLRLSRVMQAYMLHLHKITQSLSDDLMDYIHPETHQNRDFYTVLQRYKIQLDEFRQIFYVRGRYTRVSVFDAYVRDYLVDYFTDNKIVPKNTTWIGLFHQAVHWHDQIQTQEMMNKLKKNFALAVWQPITLSKRIQFSDWCFEELANLERIIEESKRYHHCLAASYAQHIVDREYVAFHMSSQAVQQHMTLGCYVRDGKLVYDQLEYSNNRKAEALVVDVAVQFIAWLNSQYGCLSDTSCR
ncbi:hypothetical protein B9T25_10540 [Acinetobacter sp. ANC 4470]|uniref:hypothetical protein n=1 Tax=Acinetobacter sp. ANC 4470 TaxID=1977881 RepID=UPI000A33CDF0|nr:hypothetical protein [Acinetobacter sp. ANC 4470]OTG66233.1 hypothetical protein B9T25_10540 [Acinetobacter sp. ANC 4470]